MSTELEYVGDQSLQAVFETVLKGLLRSKVITVDTEKSNISPPNLEDIIYEKRLDGQVFFDLLFL